MRRWRLLTQPPNPRNLVHMHEILSNVLWAGKLKYNRGTMTVRIIQTNNSHSLLIFNPDFVKKFSTSTEMVMDATFQVTPLIFGVQQLFVIMLEKYNRVSFMVFNNSIINIQIIRYIIILLSLNRIWISVLCMVIFMIIKSLPKTILSFS